MQFSRRLILAGIAAWPLRAAEPTPPVLAIADAISRQYHDAALGSWVAQALRLGQTAGRFDGLDANGTARLINEMIAQLTGDGHFAVMAGTMPGATVLPSPPYRPAPPFSPDELQYLEHANFGIAGAAVDPDGIGRLDIRLLYRPAREMRDRLAAAMETVAGSQALIVDLSRNIGGDPKTVALLLSYFFERPPFVTNRFRWRGRPVEEFRTEATPGGPIYGEARPLAVVVSRSTFSAGEEFAYDIQALKRGVIVGERTGGGANHATPQAIAGFTVFIPEARAENPITGTNWEGAGVKPDIEAAPADAIEAARKSLLQRL